MTVRPSASRYAAPRSAVYVPSVTMNGGNPPYATTAPVPAPTAAPASKATGIASGAHVAESESITEITAHMPSTEPAARSIPRVRITSVMPAARTRLMEACRATFTALSAVRNFGVSSANSTITPRSTGRIPAACSQRRTGEGAREGVTVGAFMKVRPARARWPTPSASPASRRPSRG